MLQNLWIDRWLAAELYPYQAWMSTATPVLRELGAGGLWNVRLLAAITCANTTQGTFVCPVSTVLEVLNIVRNF